ncbi:MAG TPA: hypothetical protein VGM74_19220 [Burkholderiaceae bacterium]|jgi:hypothetical protein
MNKLGGLAWGLALVAGGVGAQPAAAPRIEIGSCASGPPMSIGLADERALLADDERDALVVEMTARYPMLDRDGFKPPVILLWHKAPAEWLYVSLQPGADADASGTLCFTASFVAEQFRITPGLIRAYMH